MPICPFCRKPAEQYTIWCSCGSNLTRYSNLPNYVQEIPAWFEEYAPESAKPANVPEQAGLLDQARAEFIGRQDAQLGSKSKEHVEVETIKRLLNDFLSACAQEQLAPNVDVGALRKERWRAWRSADKAVRHYPPLKEFKSTPGYHLRLPFAKYVDEYFLCLDGSLYRHEFNAPDPYPVEWMAKSMPVAKIEEGLRSALVELLAARQEAAGHQP